MFLHQRYWNIGAEALHRHQLNISMFNELCRCYLQQWGLVSLWRATYSLGNSLVYIKKTVHQCHNNIVYINQNGRNSYQWRKAQIKCRLSTQVIILEQKEMKFQ